MKHSCSFSSYLCISRTTPSIPASMKPSSLVGTDHSTIFKFLCNEDAKNFGLSWCVVFFISEIHIAWQMI